MRRRQLLLGAGAGLAALAGCSGDGGGGGTTTTTAEVDIRSAETGSYDDWLVDVEGADVFLLTYYPAYAQVLDWLPRGGTMNRIEAERSGPTAFAEKTGVESYFQGFTRTSETNLTYADARGSFDTASVTSMMDERTEFESADAGLEGFSTYATDTAATALADDRIVWVEASGGEPLARLDAVLATLRGEREPYTDRDEALGLLLDQFRTGHQINVVPSNAEEFGVSEYGRQFVFGPERARPEEAVVFEAAPDDARATFESNSIILENYDDAAIRRVETDGRAAKAVYTTIPNSII